LHFDGGQDLALEPLQRAASGEVMGECKTGCSIRKMKTDPNKIKTVLMKAFIMVW
jgi:hypothetical protein